MGMAASQVRFLSLQSRNSNITRQLSTLSNRKMALARDMNTISQNYNNALNTKILQWSSDNGNTYSTLTYDLLMTPNELNTTTPYILTDASTGKVVLNDDALTDSDGNTLYDSDGNPISYTYLASLISSYSGLTTADDGTVSCAFDNTSRVTTASDGTVSGISAIDGAYYIPDSGDFDFDNNLRYYLFTLLGLVTDEDLEAQNQLLIQLYGSEEAKETGVYPLGCAWGDYYLALANLEAYESFTSMDQYAASNSYISGNSTSTSIDYYKNSSDSDYWDGYVYSADLNASTGTDSDTEITQETVSTSAASHIDFSSVVTTDSDGDYYVEDSDSAIISSVCDDYDDTYTLGSTGWTYGIDVSDNGITYTYSADDVWQNAVSNTTDSSELSESWGGSINSSYSLTTQDIIDKLQSSSSDDQLVEIADSGDSSLTIGSTEKSLLEAYIDGFISVLSNNSILNLDSDYLEDAKEWTASYFITYAKGGYYGANNWHSGSKKARNKAKSNADGYNGVGYARYGGWHSHSKAYVDLGTLFNTFITSYTALATGTSISGAGGQYTGQPVMEEGTYDTYNLSTKSIDGTSYTYQSATDSAGNTCLFIYGGSYTTEDYTEDDGTVSTETTYDTEISICYNNSPVQYDADGDGTAETDIYGTVEIGDVLYYATEYDQITDFLTYFENGYTAANSATSAGLTKYSETESSTSTTADLDGFYIASSESDSTYACYLAGTPVADTNYYAYLQEQVDDAWDRIEELEDDLENFYSSADQKIMDYYDALFQRIAENGWVTDNATSSSNSNANDYLNNKLQNYDYMITVCTERADETGYYYTTKLAESITKIYEVDDESVQTLALAEYEYEKTLIENKESKIDTIMEKLETEQSAITTEMESLQNVISDNIDKTFKIFA